MSALETSIVRRPVLSIRLTIAKSRIAIMVSFSLSVFVWLLLLPVTFLVVATDSSRAAPSSFSRCIFLKVFLFVFTDATPSAMFG